MYDDIVFERLFYKTIDGPDSNAS
uniref:Uncharacterized protein n=1 Tax=Lepeophtheirus salmonis TaxID=72036 RepID=A0A0K2VL62_LEPSM